MQSSVLAAAMFGFGCSLSVSGTSAPAAGGATEIPRVVAVPAGEFVAGSDRQEREYGYRLDEAAYGHGITRKHRWYESEPARGVRSTKSFSITATPVTNRQYAAFVAATGHPAPDVAPRVWTSYGLIHPYQRTRKFAWSGGEYPEGRGDHPVVMVSLKDAEAFAAWLSRRTGRAWRLPSETEWEKAARGTDGRRFPWGNTYQADRLNSHDRGPFDTLPVASFPNGASPYGMLDAAGQVFEWTRTPWRRNADGAPTHFVVKGGSWDDKGCGVCRPAARHGRPLDIKHILIGFRLVREDGH